MSQVKVRFAPSPTGFLHIGSARTALFNWLFARHEKGKFFLRIEDTDRERSRQEFLDEILDSLRWLGIDWDDDLVFQSQRTDYYRSIAEKLIREDKAYYEDKAIRFRTPKEGKIVFHDLLHGDIAFDLNSHESLKDDLVIFKSDGSPTYNFAVVCDDAQMGMTHVIRGDDHISNTPKQVPLYEALGFEKPLFCHIPLILGEDRSRMSKRHGATSIREYREAGFLPEAIVNFLSLLGWSPGNNKELMSLDEIIETFSLRRVLKTGAVFDKTKLEWMNGQYIRKSEIGRLTNLVIPYLVLKNYWKSGNDRTWLEKIVKAYKDRISTLAQLPELGSFFFEDPISAYQPESVDDINKDPRLKEVLTVYADRLDRLDNFEAKTIETMTLEFMKEVNMTAKEFIHPCRAAVTGKSATPGFYDTLSIFGKKKAVHQLRYAVQHLIKQA